MMHHGMKRAFAAALAAVLTMTAAAGCSKKESEESKAAAAAAEAEAKAMVTLNDESVSAGAFNFMLRYEMSQDWLSSFYRSMYGRDVDIWNVDIYGNGQVYGAMMKEELLHNVEHMLLEKAHMADYDVELTEEDKAAIKEAAAAFIAANDEEVLRNMSATQENVETMLTLRTIQARMEERMGEDVDTNVSDEEAAQRDVAYVSFTASTEAETEEESEELSEALSEAAEASDLAEAVTETAAEAETAVEEAAAEMEAESEIHTQSPDETEAAAEAETETEQETEDPAMAAARAEALAKAEAFLASAAGLDAEGFEAAAEEAASQSGASNGSWTFGTGDTYPDAAIIEATEGLADGTLVDHVITVGDTSYVVFVTDAFDEEATQDRKEEIVEERRDALVAQILEGWEGGSEDTESSSEAETGDAVPAEKAEFVVDQEAFAALAFDFLLNLEEESEMAVEETETEIYVVDEMDTESGTEIVSAE